LRPFFDPSNPNLRSCVADRSSKDPFTHIVWKEWRREADDRYNAVWVKGGELLGRASNLRQISRLEI